MIAEKREALEMALNGIRDVFPDVHFDTQDGHTTDGDDFSVSVFPISEAMIRQFVRVVRQQREKHLLPAGVEASFIRFSYTDACALGLLDPFQDLVSVA